MPKLGRVKTGNTPKPPKINLSGLKSDSEYIQMRRSDLSETSTSEQTSTYSDESSFESLPRDQSTPEPCPTGRISTVPYDDRQRLERLCGILGQPRNDDLIEYTLIVIFAIFAYLIFSGHF